MRRDGETESTRGERADALLKDLRVGARLLVYLASAAGAGKTRRLLDDAQRLRASGKRVALGWLETKGRPELDHLAAGLDRIPPRVAPVGDEYFEEFDLDAAVAAKPDAIILDELAHENLPGSRNVKRWEDALALRDAGISVIGAFNIAHLETAAPVAEAVLGHPVREIIPLSFLQSADEVIALDVSPELLKSRLQSGKIVRDDDIERALGGAFNDTALYALRELLLRTIDELTIPAVSAGSASTAAALIFSAEGAEPFLKRTAAIASALDLAMKIYRMHAVPRSEIEPVARRLDAELLTAEFTERGIDLNRVHASLIAVPLGPLAKRLVSRPVDRDIFVAGVGQTFQAAPQPAEERALRAIGDRIRAGYGRFTIYLGAVAGSGKTMAMLDRAHQLREQGIDVVAGFIETHGRHDTGALAEGIETIPRKRILSEGITYEEFDRDALIARRPKVALIDELAHTNAPGSQTKKRYEDVFAVLRAGIDVMTTLNVQHLEALGDAVYRLTGTLVRETLPDEILTIADEVIFIDASPETLRERLREGKIYPRERVETALTNFFKLDNLRALRELAVREAIAAKRRERVRAPFERLMLTVAPRASDAGFINRCARIAHRLGVEFTVACVASLDHEIQTVGPLREETERFGGQWIQQDTRPHDVPSQVLEIARARPQTTVAVGSTMRQPRLFEPGPFALRLLREGARELLVLARREH